MVTFVVNRHWAGCRGLRPFLTMEVAIRRYATEVRNAWTWNVLGLLFCQPEGFRNWTP